MSTYTEFFFNSTASIVELECLEISHSAFSQTYRIVRNAVNGVSVTHDGGAKAYTYYPVDIQRATESDDLDQILNITFGDLGAIIPTEIERVRAANKFGELPVVKYRTYRSDNLAAPMFGPLVLVIKKFSMKPEGATFEARAPQLNSSKTGERYSIARFSMLSGLL